MALQISYSTIYLGQKLNFDKAYVRIEKVEGDKKLLKIHVQTYTNDELHLLKSEVHAFTPSVDDESKNFIKQGYDYLKKLEEYADSMDV